MNYVCSIQSWLNANKIKINPSKCSLINFCYRSRPSITSAKIGNNTITETTHTRFLGLIVDKNLNFSYHISVIASNISKTVGILFKLKDFFPIKILRHLYFALIQPQISYTIETWYSAPKYLTNKIFTIQKKAIRAIFSLPYNSHTSNFFKLAGILKLDDLYKFSVCTLIYKSLHNDCDTNISQMLQALRQNHTHITRNYSDFCLPRYHLTRSQSSFRYCAVKIYNSLPTLIKESSSIFVFRSRLRSHFLQQY